VEAVLERNPSYWGPKPYFAKVIFKHVTSGTTQREMIERGEADIAHDFDADLVAKIKEGPKIRIVSGLSLNLVYLALNNNLEVSRELSDRRVRQAIVHAIDREAIVQDVYAGQYTFARGVLPPGTLGFNPRLGGYAYDPQRARELLAEAGYPGGRGLPQLAIWSSVKRDDIVREHDQIKKWLAAIGITAEVHYLTNWPTFSKSLDEGKLPVFLYAWHADVPDPDDFLTKLFHSRSSRNFFGYANAVVDDLLATARTAGDPQRRVELYRRAEQLILEDAPIVPVFHHTYERLFQPYVRSVEVNGLGDPYIPFRKIWLERAR